METAVSELALQRKKNTFLPSERPKLLLLRYWFALSYMLKEWIFKKKKNWADVPPKKYLILNSKKIPTQVPKFVLIH